MAIKEPENIDDPPVESSEDEPEPETTDAAQFRDSSEDDIPDIRRTTFTRGKESNTATGHRRDIKGKQAVKGTGRTTSPVASRPIRASKRTKTESIDQDEDDMFNSYKKAKIDSDVPDNEEPIFRRRPKNKPGYGKKAKQKDRPRDLSESMTPVKPFKRHDEYGSLESSPVAALKVPQKMRNQDSSSSDLSDPPSSDEKSDPPRALDIREKKAKNKKGKKIKGLESSAEPMSQMPVFKMPDAYGDYAPMEIVDYDAALDDVPVVQERQLEPGKVVCPMCDEQVDEDLLKEFSKGARMVMAQQTKFCRMHKKKTAEKVYEEKQYPRIDWTTLKPRIERHHNFLESLIMGADSHFANILTENIRSGHARTLLTTSEYLTPGYYGLRGMSLMTEMVTETFSRLLRERAPTDTRISGRGYTGFVQSVLVPELAVRLIQEDLSLDEDKAREVMVESRELGEILNDEKRQSKPRTYIESRENSSEMEDQEHEEDEGDEEDSDMSDNDLDAPADPKVPEGADSDSALSSPPSHSQSLPSVAPIPARKVDGSDTDQDTVRSGQASNKAKASIKTQKAAVDSDSSLSSPLSDTGSLPSVNGGEPSWKVDENGSNQDIAPRSGQVSKKAKAPIKTQEANALAVRASPRSVQTRKKSAETMTLQTDESGDDSDSSGLSSALDSIKGS